MTFTLQSVQACNAQHQNVQLQSPIRCEVLPPAANLAGCQIQQSADLCHVTNRAFTMLPTLPLPLYYRRATMMRMPYRPSHLLKGLVPLEALP